MDEPRNVQIPYKTFKTLLEILECLEQEVFADDFKMQIEDSLAVLVDKRESLDRRQSFTEYKRSHGPIRDEKRIDYMMKRKN